MSFFKREGTLALVSDVDDCVAVEASLANILKTLVVSIENTEV